MNEIKAILITAGLFMLCAMLFWLLIHFGVHKQAAIAGFCVSGVAAFYLVYGSIKYHLAHRKGK